MKRLYRQEANLNLTLLNVYNDDITPPELYSNVRDIICAENPMCREFAIGDMNDYIKRFTMNNKNYYIFKI